MDNNLSEEAKKNIWDVNNKQVSKASMRKRNKTMNSMHAMSIPENLEEYNSKAPAQNGFVDLQEESVEDLSEIKANNHTEDIPQSKRNQIFVFLLLANIFLNYDTGVIPASLLEIVKEVDLQYKEQALIGSLVYLGLSFASVFVTLFFNRYGPAKVCSFVLILNTLCCFVFSITAQKYVLYGTRFFMGASEAFIVIYGPVWVNNYAPAKHSAKWMGILHSCTALGVMVGYLVASIIINFLNDYVSWRFAIQIQGIAQIPIALYFYFEKEEYINVSMTSQMEADEDIESQPDETINSKTPGKNIQSAHKERIKRSATSRQDRKVSSLSEVNSNRFTKRRRFKSRLPLKDARIDTIETSNMARYCTQAKVVITNGLYITVTLGLCSMYFIVTGIQFWMTSYLIYTLDNNPITVVIIFSAVSITAPLAGVIIGGTFADKYGGYKGKNTLKALKLCLAFGMVAFVFAFPIGFLYSLIYITVLLWTFLFFGAAIVPVGTGIMVSSVRK